MVGHIVLFLSGVLVGVLLGGYIVKNNKDKAFKVLDDLKAKAEKELEEIKQKIEK